MAGSSPSTLTTSLAIPVPSTSSSNDPQLLRCSHIGHSQWKILRAETKEEWKWGRRLGSWAGSETSPRTWKTAESKLARKVGSAAGQLGTQASRHVSPIYKASLHTGPWTQAHRYTVQHSSTQADRVSPVHWHTHGSQPIYVDCLYL